MVSPVRACSTGLFTFGLAVAMLGPILPGIRADLGAGDIASGGFIAAGGAGWGLGVLSAGRLSQRRGRRASFGLGTAGLTAGLVVLAAAPAVAIAIGAVFALSLGGGLITGSANAAMAETGDRALAIANGFFAIGAITGPLLASALVGLGPGWRAAPALAAVLCAATVPLARALPAGLPATAGARHGAGGLIRRPLFIGLAAVMAIDVAAEAGFVGWVATYATEERAIADWLAALAPMAFWTGVAISRFTAARWPVGPRALAPMIACASVGTLLVLALPGAAGVLGGSLIVGLAAGPVFPIVMTAVGRLFPNDLDVAAGLILGATGAGEMLVPLALGTAAAVSGTTAAGLVVVAVTFAIATVVALAVQSRRPAYA